MGIFSKLAGTISSFFQINGVGGPGINANGAALETKNSGNSAFAVHRGATPVGDNDFTTKAYVDKTANKPIPVSLQISGASALPNNSGTEQWYVVTTTGGSGTIGQLYWDDGSGAGVVQVIPAVAGNMFFTTAAFSGGTISLAANQLYAWSGSAWVAVVPSVSGAMYQISFALGTATASSATQIPANAIVTDTELDITTAYSAGATISVGQTGTAALLMATGDNTPQTVNQYNDHGRVAWGASALAVLATIAGAPSTGVAVLTVTYCVPNN